MTAKKLLNLRDEVKLSFHTKHIVLLTYLNLHMWASNSRFFKPLLAFNPKEIEENECR